MYDAYVHYIQNLGAILRSCLFFNVSGVVICRRNSAPLSPYCSKASVCMCVCIRVCVSINVFVWPIHKHTRSYTYICINHIRRAVQWRQFPYIIVDEHRDFLLYVCAYVCVLSLFCTLDMFFIYNYLYDLYVHAHINLILWVYSYV